VNSAKGQGRRIVNLAVMWPKRILRNGVAAALPPAWAHGDRRIAGDNCSDD
jgi:hypothetical protein